MVTLQIIFSRLCVISSLSNIIQLLSIISEGVRSVEKSNFTGITNW